jgi:hypothetical protein
MESEQAHPDAGKFYAIRYRLRGKLSHQRGTLGRPWTPSQEEAWLLLNEVEELVKVLELIAKYLPPDNHSELAYRVRHALLMHHPAWKPQE